MFFQDARVHALVTLLHSSSVEDTLHTLDSDGNGVISKSEIAAYAQSQGIRVQDILGDFSAIDTNGDGNLDAMEISKALDEPQAEQVARQEPAKVAVTATAPETAAAPKSMVATLVSNTEQAKLAEVDHSKDGLLEIEALQKSAEQQAGSIMATSMASRVQQLLKQSASDKASAETYKKRAIALRGSASKLLQSALQDTKRAAMQTTAKVTNATMPQFQQLEAEEEDAKRKAVEHRGLARKAMDNVIKAQAMLAKPLQVSSA
jgi:Ca2+-binding EF-hand superfamily protein